MHEPSTWLPRRRSAFWALLLLVPAPSIGVLAALLSAGGEAGGGAGGGGVAETLGRAGEISGGTSEGTPGGVGQMLWVASKGWILLLPVCWHVLIDRQKLRIPRPSFKGMPAALMTGVIIFAGIAGLYYTVGRGWFDADQVAGRIAGAGLDRPWLYLLMAVYWCTINSLLEEYVWRWFVFTRCQALMPRYAAVGAAGLFFTIHHTIAMGLFFGEAKTVAFASLGVFIGGATWSWIYLRWRNIYAAYLSHVFADLIIFWIGYQLLFLR